MMREDPKSVTELLANWREGDCNALDRVVCLVHDELRTIARAYLNRERSDHTLQPSALINEAYVQLLSAGEVPWQNRAHFYAAAAQVMRHVLVDYGRQRQRLKRGPGEVHLSCNDDWIATPARFDEVLAIDRALERLAAIDLRKSRVVEMRFFGGLSVEETAEALGVAANTVIRDWSFARAWLRRELEGGAVR